MTIFLEIIKSIKDNPTRVVFICFPPWQETFADARDGDGGGNQYGPIFVPPPIGYNRKVWCIYVIYIDLYTFTFIYIMKKLLTSSKTCFILILFASWQICLSSPGMGMGETTQDQDPHMPPTNMLSNPKKLSLKWHILTSSSLFE